MVIVGFIPATFNLNPGDEVNLVLGVEIYPARFEATAACELAEKIGGIFEVLRGSVDRFKTGSVHLEFHGNRVECIIDRVTAHNRLKLYVPSGISSNSE